MWGKGKALQFLKIKVDRFVNNYPRSLIFVFAY